jgi:predicted signal transduction protein with EAL and GGDEF domain/CheY-like chemotaxis protein
MTEPGPSRILIADDDQVLLLVLRAGLEAGGFSVITANNGLEAVERFDSDAPDCIILDVMMPKMDGFEACRTIRSRHGGKDVPILILTSLDDLASVSRAYQSGATDFAAKGLSNRLLQERVRFLLRAYQAHQALRSSRSRLHAVQKLARVGHWEVTAEGVTIDVSHIVQNVLGIDAASLGGLDGLRSALRSVTVRRFDECVQRWRSSGAAFELDGRAKNGAFLYIRGAPAAVERPGMQPPLTLAIQDITAVRRAQRHAQRLANFDLLTGLPNRRYFLQTLAEALEGRPASKPLAVLAVSVQGHERLTQSVGASAADHALVEVGRALRSSMLGESSSGRRLGHVDAGQFALALPLEESPGVSAQVCEDLLEALAAPISGPGWVLAVDARVGIAIWPQDGDNAEALLANAMATAGRLTVKSTERYSFFAPEIQAGARRRLQLESELRHALERQQLSLVYQPRLELDDLHICGTEALMRWNHPTFGLVSPYEFIPIAEASSLIDEIGRWALDEACRQLAEWRTQFNRGLTVSVNVSARQLHAPQRLLDTVRASLAAHSLPASALQLELTESMIIHAGPDLLELLAELRATGVTIALDDFGTGYSSLSYLRKLPVDTLKIDRSFVSDLPTDPSAEGVLRAILSVAEALHLRTVAEGVETIEQFRQLRGHGCREGQGYLFARPLIPRAFETLLRNPQPISLPGLGANLAAAG